MPEISVITVCYNAAATIAATVNSVLNQTFRDFEYIIIDGGSTDQTLEILEDARKDTDISFKMISEKDRGIYDAMNKGIKLASGKWYLFLNADDSLFNNTVFEKFHSFQIDHDADVIYGDCNRIKGNESRIDVADEDIELIRKGKFFCHQATFTKREWFDNFQFNEKFPICSDYDFFLRLYLNGAKFLHFPEVVCNYSVEGLSNKRYYKTILENYKVRIQNGIDKDSAFVYLKALIWNIKHAVKKEW